jgi:hypothetical protein
MAPKEPEPILPQKMRKTFCWVLATIPGELANKSVKTRVSNHAQIEMGNA